jgi:hypothetical protein
LCYSRVSSGIFKAGSDFSIFILWIGIENQMWLLMRAWEVVVREIVVEEGIFGWV